MTVSLKQAGFTIVELLIVIVVIAVLATIATIAYSGLQERARDSIRKNDLEVLAKAIGLYYADNGNYPMTSGWRTQISNPTSSYNIAFKNALAPYLNQIPSDPKFRSTYQDYFYHNINGQSYGLYAELEGSDENIYNSSGATNIDATPNLYDLKVP